MRSDLLLAIIYSLILLLLSGCGDLFGLNSSNKKTQSDVSLAFNVGSAKTVFILNEYESSSESTDASPVSSHLYAIDKNDKLGLAETKSTGISYAFVVHDPNSEFIYVAIDTRQIKSNSRIFRLLEKYNCTVFKVSRIDNSFNCLMEGIAIDQYLHASWEMVASDTKPIQFDEQGNTYFLGKLFTLECYSYLNATNYSNGDKVCAEGQQNIVYDEKAEIEIIPIESSNTLDSVENSNTITSFLVFPNGEIAYVTKDIETGAETFVLELEGSTVEVNKKVGAISNYAIFNENTLLWNTSELVHWSGSSVNYATLKTELVPTGGVIVDCGRVYVSSDDLLFQLLPPQVKAKSTFATVNGVSPLLEAGYAIYLREVVEDGKTNHLIVVQNLLQNSETLFLEDKMWKVIHWRLSNRRLLFTAVEQASGLLMSAEIWLDQLESNSDKSSSLKLIKVNKEFGRYRVTDIEPVIEVADAEEEVSAPYVKEIFTLAENRNSISMDFSQSMNKDSVLENIILQDASLNSTSYLPLWLGNTLHLIIDDDGVSNNELEFDIHGEVELKNQRLLLPLQVYNFSLDGIAIAQNGRSLSESSEPMAHSLTESFSTIVDGKTYLANAEKFNRELGVASTALVNGTVLAQAPCISTCSAVEYNLGISENGNVRHEFSISNNMFELILWNKTNYGASYNFSYSRDLQFKLSGTEIVVRAGDQEKTLILDENDTRYWLSQPNKWRRYRMDIFGSNIQMSYSLDNVNFEIIDELTFSNAPNFFTSADEHTWLLGFSGAIDEWNTSSLSGSNTLSATEGDIVNLTFDSDFLVPADSGENDEIGFDDNLGNSFPVTVGPGSPDVTFGLKGGVYFGGEADWLGDSSAMAVDNQGRVLLAAKTRNGSNFDMAVWRITQSGELDTAFAEQGLLTHHNAANGDFDDSAEAIVVDSFGHIYVAGHSFNGSTADMTLWRLTDEGALDPTFNNGQGYAIYSSDTDDSAYSITIDSFGRIVVAGVSNSRAAIWVYLPSGLIDASFNGGAMFLYNEGLGSVASVITDADNNIYVTGDIINAENNLDMLLLKLSPSGLIQLEMSYDGIGSNIGNDTYGVSISLDHLQRLIVFGYELNGQKYDLVLWRLNSNGELDTLFADQSTTPGRITYNSGDSDFAYSMAIDIDGNINLLASSADQNRGLYMIRYSTYNRDGKSDETFDSDGVLHRTGFSGRVIAANVDGQEKLYVSGMRVTADGFEGERGVWRINLK